MIKFFNIRSREVQVADSEPKIAALFNSSNLGVNAMQGQDFGWRLAPEVVVEMRRIQRDPVLLQSIAQRFQKNVDELSDPDILQYISLTNEQAGEAVATPEDYSADYEAEIRRQEAEANTRDADESVKSDTTSKNKK